MANDVVEIYNLALSAVGHRSPIALPTENSREAKLCNRWYPTVRDQILRGAPWQSTRDTANLSLTSERDFDLAWATGDPEPPWAYKYSAPEDFLYPRFLDSFQNFILGDNEGSPVIFTNESEATMIFTKKQIAPPAWDVSLRYAIIHGLAAHIAKPLTGKISIARDALDMANSAIIQARIATANENSMEYESVPDWLVARGIVTGTNPSRFIFPTGPLLSFNGTF